MVIEEIREHVIRENRYYDLLVSRGFRPQGWNERTNTVCVGVPIVPEGRWKYDYRSYKSWEDAYKQLVAE